METALKMYLALGLPVAALAVAGTAAGAAFYGPDESSDPPIAPATDTGSTLDVELLTLQEEDTDDPEAAVDRFLQRLAGKLGIEEQTLRDAIGQTSLDMLEEAVADGDIPQDIADRIRERIEAGELGGPFIGGWKFRHGFDDGGPRPGIAGPGLIFGLASGLDDVADFLGLSIDELGDALADGSTLGEVAEANGKTEDELRQYLTDSITSAVNEAVAQGDLSQERADSILENVDDRVDALLDGSLRFGHGPEIRRGAGVGPFGPFGPWHSDGGSGGSEGGESESGDASLNTA